MFSLHLPKHLGTWPQAPTLIYVLVHYINDKGPALIYVLGLTLILLGPTLIYVVCHCVYDKGPALNYVPGFYMYNGLFPCVLCPFSHYNDSFIALRKHI